MNAHSVVEDWETTPFEGGFDGLAELTARGFDGAVETAGTWLFLRDGDAVAVVADLQSSPRSGDIDVFEAASGRQHEAPTPAAVTVAAMLALDGEVRGQYFTDDTPLSAVHDTLSEGGFTGYVELSENVLSGDYYSVYVDGEAEHVGFIGSGRLVSGDEAQTKAEDEVGIYAVVAVSLPELELPKPEPDPEPEPDPTPVAEPDSEATTESTATPGSDTTEDTSDPVSETERAPDETAIDTETDADPDAPPTTGTETTSADAAATDRAASERGTETTTPDHDYETDTSKPTDDYETSTADPSTDSRSLESARDDSPSATTSTETDSGGTDAEGVSKLATRQVPSLDPEQSSHSASESSEGDQRRSTSPGRSSGAARSPGTETSPERTTAGTGGRARKEYEAKLDEYEDRLEARASRIEELEAELDERDGRIDELEAELAAVRNERDELQARLEAQGPDTTGATNSSLSPEEALRKTSLFIRERTRGGATLQDAHAGTEDRDTVVENLRIDYHATFDSTDAVVEGDPFETWLRSSSPYKFAEWLVTELLFEIRSTDTQDGLRPMYDALPLIDRIGFDETITVDENDEERDVQLDIVARDKKGNPIVVAHFDQRREPTHAETITPFVADSSDVCEANETLEAAVAVTSSYFESDAMSVTEEATSTSLLSRSKHRSYVKLSRSNGYHLCLVEARENTFNLTIPEL